MLWWAEEMDDGYLCSSANTLVCTRMQLFPIIFSNYFFTWETVQRGMKTTKHLCEIWMQVFQKCFFSVYPILLWVNKHQKNHVGGLLAGGFIFFHEFKYQLENLKEEVIPFLRVLVFVFFFWFVWVFSCMKSHPMAQSTGAWENFLGKYLFMICHPGYTHDMRCGTAWVL